jgi:hypothetical protein
MTTASRSRYEERRLLKVGDFDGSGAFYVVVRHCIDPVLTGTIFTCLIHLAWQNWPEWPSASGAPTKWIFADGHP